MRATALLREDHKQILRALNILERMSARAQRGGGLEESDLEHILQFLHGFADRHHQGKEEGVFFPSLLKDRSQKHYPELCKAIFEHDRERSLVEGLQDSARTRNTKDFVYYANRLIAVLREHIEKEERILFELADSTLSGAEDDRVVTDMQNYELTWQQNVLSQLLSRLDELESRYS
jgi:hemerythrin-like domain-containing protein